jgi:hypothetical protein
VQPHFGAQARDDASSKAHGLVLRPAPQILPENLFTIVFFQLKWNLVTSEGEMFSGLSILSVGIPG